MNTPSERFDLVAARVYQTRSGEDKKHWINCGEAVKWSDGNITIRLDAVPTFAGWDGKLSLFVKKEREQQAAPQRQAPKPAASDGFDSEIPF